MVQFDDPEMEALAMMASALEPLDRMARARVIKWAEDRFLDQPKREVEDLSWASIEAQMKAYEKYAKDLGIDQRTLAHALAHERSGRGMAPIEVDSDPKGTESRAMARADGK